MYENLTAKINSYHDAAAAKFAEDLETITTAHALDHRYYRDRMTPAAFQLAQETPGDQPIPEMCKVKMRARFARENDKARAKALHKLETAAACAPLECVEFAVEWVNSKTWGKNPSATVRASSNKRTCETSATASGCGYDKESAAIAQACNANPQLMRILYDHAEAGGEFPYSVFVGKDGLPWIDGGCGMSCWRAVFEACGYRFRDIFHSKACDVYSAEKIAE